MSQEPLNSPNNVNLAHGVSAWFQRDFTGDRIEFGDFVLESFTPSPEFLDHFSYRDGLRALRTRLLTQKAATMSFTLNEASILNLQRAAFGGDITSGNSHTIYEARQATLKVDTGDELYVDMAELDTDATTSTITVTGVFELSDSLQEFGMAVQSSGVPDGNGHVAVANTTETTALVDDTVNVVYEIAETNLFRTEIFGASGTSIKGALQVQLRNQSGGIVQIYDLASADLSANGDIPFPVDAIQTIPLIANLQERGGTFGAVYTK